MAKNKITFEKEYMEDGRWEYRFTGSQREPTLTEAMNHIVENRLWDEIDDAFGIAYARLKEEVWTPPEENRTLILIGYDGGQGEYNSGCPICGHERDMGGKTCPICGRPWE